MLPLLLSRYLFEKHRLGPGGVSVCGGPHSCKDMDSGGHLDASLRSRESDDQAIESGGSGQQAHNTRDWLCEDRGTERGRGTGLGREGGHEDVFASSPCASPS